MSAVDQFHFYLGNNRWGDEICVLILRRPTWAVPLGPKATTFKHLRFVGPVSRCTEAGSMTYTFPESSKCSTSRALAAVLVLAQLLGSRGVRRVSWGAGNNNLCSSVLISFARSAVDAACPQICGVWREPRLSSINDSVTHLNRFFPDTLCYKNHLNTTNIDFDDLEQNRHTFIWW